MTGELLQSHESRRRVDPARVHVTGLDAKIVVLGNSGVGKTTLLQRYVQDNYDPAHTTATTSAFFAAKRVYLDNQKVRLQLWDTAGQERFRSMAPIYYRGANAALLLYDITSLSTFEDLKTWLQELKKNCSDDLIIYIVGAKADLYPKRQVSQDRIRLYLRTWFPPPLPQIISPPPNQPYSRMRFTSLTNITTSNSVPFLSPRARTKSQSHSPPMHPSTSPPKNALQRSKTTTSSNLMGNPPGLTRRSTTSTVPAPVKHVTSEAQNSKFRRSAVPEHNSSSANLLSTPMQFPGSDNYRDDVWKVEELDEATDEKEESEWDASNNIRLFEVSSKDDQGVQELFDALIRAIISKRDILERERELRERDSVYLGSTSLTPMWAAVADEEEANLAQLKRWQGCC